MQFRSFGKGFTLIELLVVIAIIGILAGIVLASLSSGRVAARDAQRAAQARQFQQALETYAIANNGTYPCALNTCTTAVQHLSLYAGTLLTGGGFLSSIPNDPTYPSSGVRAVCNTANGAGYCYCSNGGGYVLTVNTENDDGGSARCYIRAGNYSGLCNGHQPPGTWATEACSVRLP